MALGVGRAALLVGLGWAALVSALLPPQPPVYRHLAMDRRSPEEQRAFRLDFHARAEGTALRAMERRENFVALARRPHTAGPQVWVNPVIAADSRARAEDLVRTAWRASNLGAPQVPVLIAIDTSGSRWEPAEYFLPIAPGEPCVAHIMTETRRDAHRAPRLVLRPASIQRLLGPCALYAAFGMPGASIRDWLVHGGLEFGLLPHATGSSSAEDFTVTSRLIRPELRLDLMACRLGQTTQCATFLRRGGSSRYWTDDGYQPARIPGWIFLPWEQRSVDATLLSDLASERGHAAMAAFWHSSAPVDGAFSAAFGETDGVWTGGWVRRHLGWDPLEVGWSSVAITVIVIAVLMLVGVGAATRRQVSA